MEMCRLIAVQMRRRIITCMANKRRKHAANREPDGQGEVPWWTLTPEEEAAHQAFIAELDAYRKGIADGTIKRKPLTRAQWIIGLHMQAGFES